ncbi:SOS response-associated peptidase family protein [Variovorax sp. RT4R15]|uniref:SOS response-associated peptidase family protein n=1 Tax=Variovorax sp. RT4R15 TaxID=3443737 RepID=UPI003F48108C
MQTIVNAGTESVASRPTFRDAWKDGQRCIIPAASFDETIWESGKNIWWRLRRADGAPWDLAGLWSVWTDPATGDVLKYTMLTLKADSHPLMNRMHKPDRRLARDKQEKRNLIPIQRRDVDQWLAGTVEESKALLKLTPYETFEASPWQLTGSAA